MRRHEGSPKASKTKASLAIGPAQGESLDYTYMIVVSLCKVPKNLDKGTNAEMIFTYRTLRGVALSSAVSVSWLLLSPSLALAQPEPLGKGVTRKLTPFERGHIKGRQGKVRLFGGGGGGIDSVNAVDPHGLGVLKFVGELVKSATHHIDELGSKIIELGEKLPWNHPKPTETLHPQHPDYVPPSGGTVWNPQPSKDKISVSIGDEKTSNNEWWEKFPRTPEEIGSAIDPTPFTPVKDAALAAVEWEKDKREHEWTPGVGNAYLSRAGLSDWNDVRSGE